ncbi:RimK family protein [Jejuia pallidilutea]|uniref:Ribosomal protein S6 glutaminyl transferase related protein n=1 Tax=Jejuia pallidilutea TaxID=504487 RepID=A0A090W492_9FLAO|nr:RimK family protein [Jejuia pallidilutea]GAL68085.1 ribosomal protein S6 glutaminyl transferase related protein [Jejuia pallidilutea]GAL71766.1 ribosomal protein S6 glutaminyl transferase related protein [Jejuia pallidilutea]GAL91083.1 ribosomal protein S6 glutaminyl transferase related protein [Jejuia pallidilutea]
MQKYIVVNQPEKWNFLVENITVISSQDYLTNPKYALLKKARIFNLCKEYNYQSKGYYVSLLAEAREHLPIPTVKNIVDLKNLKLVRIVSDEFDDIIQKSLKNIKSQEFVLSIYFGQNVARKYKELSNLFYKHFQVPFFRVKFSFNTKWQVQSVKVISELEIPNDHLESVQIFANEYFSKKRYDTPKLIKSDFDLAILVNPNDPAPPSNPKALKKFVDIAEKMNIYAEIIHPKDLTRLSSFDALFIRQSTEVNNEAYAFARKAQQEGIAIIDYPDAILKCCNKVYMAEALQNANINTPKTSIVHKNNLDDVLHYTGLPCVLKAPDSTFSFGVKKAKTKEEFYALANTMLKSSDLIIAQEFCPSSFDWRIGLIDGEPFFACKYYMAKNHWQIYNWKAKNKNDQDGNADSLPIEDVPKNVLDMAVKSGKLIGKGLLGIDIKIVDKKPMVIEINDNPNIDFGVEDLHYGDLVYSKILNALKNRLD